MNLKIKNQLKIYYYLIYRSAFQLYNTLNKPITESIMNRWKLLFEMSNRLRNIWRHNYISCFRSSLCNRNFKRSPKRKKRFVKTHPFTYNKLVLGDISKDSLDYRFSSYQGYGSCDVNGYYFS